MLRTGKISKSNEEKGRKEKRRQKIELERKKKKNQYEGLY